MATINTVSGIHTPNEGRIIWNDNFTAVNTEVEGLSTTIGSVSGSLVGTTSVQVLENKTISSSYRGGNNTVTVSRRDLESTAFILVTSDSGSVSDMDVSAASQYSLQILGSNGIDTYVTSNVFYVRNSATCILNEASQVLGVGVASVTGGTVAEFGGNVLVNNYLGAGDGHTAAPSAELHLKSSSPELRIETTTVSGQSSTAYYGDGDNFTWSADFTPGTEYLRLRFNGASLATFYGTGGLTLTQDVTFSKVGGAHTFVGDVDIQGTLTAGGLVATATDVIINNGPVTISGGWTYIADGAINHDKLSPLPSGYLIVGGPGAIPTAVDVQGVVTMSEYGVFTFQDNVVDFSHMVQPNDNTIIGGTGSGSDMQALSNGGGDVSFARSSGTLIFTIGSNVIDNANINSAAAIDMSKTAFAVSISGIEMNGNTLELASTVKPDILFRYVPAGTIISYAGDLGSLSSTNLVEPVPGWFYCNGATYSTSTYGDLYNALGSSRWGGAGKLPDLMGMFLRGLDPSGAIDPDLGRVVGDIQLDAFKAHTHTYGNSSEWGSGNYNSLDARNAGSYTTGSTGGDETRPINVTIYWLIKY